jgi:tetratricopeptide (TPR) repeat protein
LCWYDTKPDAAVALADYLIRYYPPTDENVAWGYVILGRYHFDYMRFKESVNAYKAALNVAARSRWGPFQWLPLSFSFAGVSSYASVAQLGLGATLLTQGEVKAAIDVLDEAARMDRKDPAARHLLGLARMVLNPKKDAADDFDQADALIKKAIHDYDRQGGGAKGAALAHISLGTALQQQGRAGAASEFKRAMELDRDSSDARTAYCQLLLEEAESDGYRLFNDNFDSCVASIERKAGDVNAHFLLANFFLVKGKRTDAVDATAIEYNPDNSRYHANRAAALKKQGLLSDAEAEYQQAFKLAGRSDTELNNLGNAFYDRDDFVSAAKAHRDAIAIEARVVPYHDALAKALRKLKQLDEVINEYKATIKLEVTNASRHNGLGNLFFDNKDFTNAASAYRKALAIEPDRAIFHANLAGALRELKEFDAAVKEYGEAIKLEATSASHHNGLGNVFFDNKDFANSAEAYRKALAIEPRSAVYHANLAGALRGLKQLEAAIKEYETAIELEPANATHDNNLGNILADDKEDFAKAAEAYRKAIAIEPNDPIYHSNLGGTLRELKQLDAAIKECERAIELAPDKIAGHNCLGSALYENEDFTSAAQAFREAVKLDPTDAQSHHYLGLALSRLDPDSREALDEYRTAIKLDRSYAEAYYFLATALAGRGTEAERKEACGLYREGAQIDPSKSKFNDGIRHTCE